MVGRAHDEQRPAQRNSSRFSRVFISFLIADVALFSYILSGYVFAGHIAIPDRQAMAARLYDQNAKPSPLIVWRPAPRRAKAVIPVIDASSVAETDMAGADTQPAYRTISAPVQQGGVNLLQGHAAAPDETGAPLSGSEKRNDMT